MSQKLPANNFEWIKDISQFNKDFMQNYNKESNERYFLEVHVEYLENHLYNDLPFLSRRMNIENVEKLVANLHDKTEYVIHTRNSKQALNHGLVLKNVHWVIKFNQNGCLKSYINMKTDFKKSKKYVFFKFKLMNDAVFGKTMKNVRKQRY